MLRKVICPYKYIDIWKKFNETKPPTKVKFHTNLNIQDITDAGFKYAKRVQKDSELKSLCDYHDLYIQSDIILHFLSALGLAWQARLKKNRSSIHQYANASDKYMKGCNKNKESPYLIYQGANNLYGCTMPQKLLVDNFE